jgi:alkylhydroperoxidase family enzyme
MDLNAAVGGRRGLAREKIDAAVGMRSASGALDEREALALELADGVSATPVDVPDALFERLRRTFSEREIVELVSTISHESYNSKFNRSLRIESNGFCELPLPTPEQATASTTPSSTTPDPRRGSVE